VSSPELLPQAHMGTPPLVEDEYHAQVSNCFRGYVSSQWKNEVFEVESA